MKSHTRLDSAVFHLTPTRTRCDLIIIANDKKETIASGLLNPFIAHLKAAQEQIEKGGYSIVLEPQVNDHDATWFTKGTLERFVRFVSTPEILERVCTIELEILQIEEGIALQGTIDIDHTSVDDDNKTKRIGSYESKISIPESTNEKAIILYKPEEHKVESNQQVLSEGSSKVQLLKVLESRKNVLEKEQGMAFARAEAAGFSIDDLSSLLSFAECFGAVRLMDACKKFMNLWKKKHETGQWLEIEAPISNNSEFSSLNVSPNLEKKQNESGNYETQAQILPQEFLQNQFSHPMFNTSWPIHSPQGTNPVFPAYPVQGMPYYQNYPGPGPFYQTPNIGKKRNSMDDYQDSDSIKKTGRSSKKKSDKIVIRNINYVTSKASNESESESDSDNEEIHEMKPNKKEGFSRSLNEPNIFNTETAINGDNNGPWQAFQNLLLKGVEEDNVKIKRHQNIIGDESGLFTKGSYNEVNYKSDMQITENRLLSRASDDFMHSNTGGKFDKRNFLEPEGVNEYQNAVKKGDMSDESFIVSSRLKSFEDRKTIDMDSEITLHEKTENVTNYEPDTLSLMPERGIEKGGVGFDYALEFKSSASQENKKNVKEETKCKSKVGTGVLDKKRIVGGPVKKEKSSRTGLLEDAKARAEKLRSYKADIQKMKKEKEEEDLKRLEALKLERQKRIAKRANSATTNNTQGSSIRAKSLPTKFSPVSYKGSSSKFSDSEPGVSSPLQRSKIRTISRGSSDSKTGSKPGKTSNNSNQMGDNRLTRSVSSLSRSKKEGLITPDSKGSMARIRRLSEPKTVNNPVITTKSRSVEPLTKKKVIDGLNKKKISPIVKKVTPKVEKKSMVKDESVKINDGKKLEESEVDENPIVEKSVVMLQYDNEEVKVKNEVVSDYDDVMLTSSVSGIEKLDTSPVVNRPQHVRFNSHEVIYGQKDSPKIPTKSSSPGSSISEVRPLVVADKIPEASEKTLLKESPKGFRRLLMFGKKNHSSSTGDQSLDFDNSSVKSFEPDDNNNKNTNEVNTLKNLISQKETPPTGSASRKSIRRFSLFTPFRSKTSLQNKESKA